LTAENLEDHGIDAPAAITYVYSYPMQSTTPVLLELSANAEEILGYSEAEWRADPYLWQRLLHPEDAQEAIAATWRTTFQRVAYDLDYRMVTRDSRIVWIRDTAEVDRLADGAEIWRGSWTVIPEPT
jgi:PAS domain-containing protein